jgi:hypothetical protein
MRTGISYELRDKFLESKTLKNFWELSTRESIQGKLIELNLLTFDDENFYTNDQLENTKECFFYGFPAGDFPRKLSYFTAQKIEQIIADGQYTKCLNAYREKFGIVAKAGKVIGRIFPDLPADKIGALVNEIFADDEIKTIEISDKPSEIYTTASENFGSCMADMNKDTFEIYDDNCKILYTKKDGVITSRALLWENIEFPSLGKTLSFIDRVFPREKAEIYKAYALKNDHVVRSKHILGYRDDFIYNGKEFRDEIYKELKYRVDAYDALPYIDTLTCTDGDNNLSNLRGCHLIQETDGAPLLGSSCDQCGRSIHEDETYYSESGNMTLCQYCCDNYYVWVDSENDYISQDETFYCADCGEYHLTSCATETASGDYVCSTCLENNYRYCDDCSEWHHLDNTTILHSGDYVCNDCIENYVFCEECQECYTHDETKEFNGVTYCEDCCDYIKEEHEKKDGKNE